MAVDEIKIPIICGPTASGKTAIAVKLANSHPIEIISADSRQIIKYLEIGTAKPTDEERSKLSFHLLDLIEPGERYTAFRFIDDAGLAMKNILSQNHIPVIVGGTGLYLRALTEGVVEIEQADFTIRENLEKELDEKGSEYLYKKLLVIDPIEAAKFHPNNNVRLIRALEIYQLTGKSKSELMATGAYQKSKFEFEFFCLLPDRTVLYDVINKRVDLMLENGLLAEIEKLCENGLKEKITNANVIGYSELLKHLNGNLSYDEAVNLIKQNTRRYAKRQYTWFKKQISGNYFTDGNSLYKAALDHIAKQQNLKKT